MYVFNRTIRKTEGKRNNHKSKPEEEIIKIPDGMPVIISRELWKAVSDKMDGNKKARAANSAKEITSDIIVLEKDLKTVMSDINNIVEAIAKGMFHESMKEKMDDLETRKSALKIRLEEAKHQAVIHAPMFLSTKKCSEYK